MQIRPTGKLTQTSKDTRNTLATLEDKILQNKDTGTFMHKILAKYWQNYIFMTTFCQFSSLSLSMYWQKQYHTKKSKTLKTRMSD